MTAGGRRCLGLTLLILPLLAGCRRPGGAAVAAEQPHPPTLFTDRAAAVGIAFRQGHGGRSPLTIRDTVGSGCAMFDADGDGWLDLLLVGQSGAGEVDHCMLYRNLRNGRFEDVTRGSGLEQAGCWMGAATGDFDNDGRMDLFVTGYGRCALYRNAGSCRFTDVTARAGVGARRADDWCTSAAFADYDRDGLLDLYVGQYVEFGPRARQYCAPSNVTTSCGPEEYPAQRGRLFRNRGGGRFEDVTQATGVGAAHGKTLGVAWCDYDGDGYPDLYLANDEVPGDLFHNLGKGRFSNAGTLSSTAFNSAGGSQGGMGVDFGDYDGDGRPDLVVTTFQNEPDSVYHDDGGGLFTFVSSEIGVASPTRERVGWGVHWLDYDCDGWLDLFVTNGHSHPNVEAFDRTTTYLQTSQLFRNELGRTFREVSQEAGFTTPVAGRGAAFGDYDNDGAVDILVTNLEGAPQLLHNDARADNHWLEVELKDRRRDTAGAKVTASVGSRRLVRELSTGGSYESASSPRVHFGLGAARQVDRLEIRWPDGHLERRAAVAADQILVVRKD